MTPATVPVRCKGEEDRTFAIGGARGRQMEGDSPTCTAEGWVADLGRPEPGQEGTHTPGEEVRQCARCMMQG